jgi:LEA14-like dessication related protein
MNIRAAWGVPVVALALSVAACNRVRAPDVELTDVKFAGFGLQGISLSAELSIENPNGFAIEADSISFELEAGNPDQRGAWTRVTSGTSRERLRVEEHDTAETAVPIQFAYNDLAAPVRAMLNKGTLDYRVRGHVWIRRPLPVPVPFSHTGSVSLSGAGN